MENKTNWLAVKVLLVAIALGLIAWAAYSAPPEVLIPVGAALLALLLGIAIGRFWERSRGKEHSNPQQAGVPTINYYGAPLPAQQPPWQWGQTPVPYSPYQRPLADVIPDGFSVTSVE